IYPGGGGDDALCSVDQFGVGGLDVDHEIAVDGPAADHYSGADHVKDELGSCSGLKTGAAGEDLGTGDGSDSDIGCSGDGGAGYTGERNGERADFAGVVKSAEDVRRPAAGGNADERVLRRDAV